MTTFKTGKKKTGFRESLRQIFHRDQKEQVPTASQTQSASASVSTIVRQANPVRLTSSNPARETSVLPSARSVSRQDGVNTISDPINHTTSSTLSLLPDRSQYVPLSSFVAPSGLIDVPIITISDRSVPISPTTSPRYMSASVTSSLAQSPHGVLLSSAVLPSTSSALSPFPGPTSASTLVEMSQPAISEQPSSSLEHPSWASARSLAKGGLKLALQVGAVAADSFPPAKGVITGIQEIFRIAEVSDHFWESHGVDAHVDNM